jgi:hypothetical protein
MVTPGFMKQILQTNISSAGHPTADCAVAWKEREI